MRDRADMWDHTCLDEYETQTELKDYNDTFSEFGDRDEVSQQIRGPAMHFTLSIVRIPLVILTPNERARERQKLHTKKDVTFAQLLKSQFFTFFPCTHCVVVKTWTSKMLNSKKQKNKKKTPLLDEVLDSR